MGIASLNPSYVLPPGTTVTRDADQAHWNLDLPDNAGLVIPALAATAPPRTTLRVTHNGRLESAPGNGATMVVRGVPLNSMNLYVRGARVVALLKEPFAVAGENEAGGYRRQHRPHDG